MSYETSSLTRIYKILHSRPPEEQIRVWKRCIFKKQNMQTRFISLTRELCFFHLALVICGHILHVFGIVVFMWMFSVS